MDQKSDKEEALLQEVYTQKLKISQLETLISENGVLEAEINAANKKLQDAEIDYLQVLKLNTDLQEQNGTLKYLLEKEQDEVRRLQEKLEEAEKNLLQDEKTQVHPPHQSFHDSFLLAAQSKVQDLEEEIESLKGEKAKTTELMVELQMSNQSTTSQLEEMTLMYEMKRDELIAMTEILQNLKEEKVLLECEVMELKVPSSDKRGNSLFAEVEDKRLSIQKNLQVMKIKYKKLSEKYTKCQMEMKKLKEENAQLLQQAGDDEVREIESKMMTAYQTRIKDLENAIYDYSERPISPTIKMVDCGDLEMVSAMVERARTERETLRKELLDKSQKLSEQANEVYLAQKQHRLVKAANQIKDKEIEMLKDKIKDLEEREKMFLTEKNSHQDENGKENYESNQGFNKKSSTKFVRFSEVEDVKNISNTVTEVKKEKVINIPKGLNHPTIFMNSNQGLVLQVNSELKKTKDSLKRDK